MLTYSIMSKSLSKQSSINIRLAIFFYCIALLFVIIFYSSIIYIMFSDPNLRNDPGFGALFVGIGLLQVLLMLLLIVGIARRNRWAMRLGVLFSVLALLSAVVSVMQNELSARWFFEYVPAIAAGALLFLEQRQNTRS